MSVNYPNYYVNHSPRYSAGEKVGHFTEKNLNRLKTGALATGTIAVGTGVACLANNLNNPKATTVIGAFKETFPNASEFLGGVKSGVGLITKYTGLNYCFNQVKNFGKFLGEQTGLTGVKQSTIDFVKRFGYKTAAQTGSEAKQLNSLGKLITDLKGNFSKMSGKNKLIGAIGLATLATVGYIFQKGKYNAGRIDQKYDDRSRFV